MIVHINHIAQSKKKAALRSPQSEIASLVTGSMMSMVEDGILAAKLAFVGSIGGTRLLKPVALLFGIKLVVAGALIAVWPG